MINCNTTTGTDAGNQPPSIQVSSPAKKDDIEIKPKTDPKAALLAHFNKKKGILTDDIPPPPPGPPPPDDEKGGGINDAKGALLQVFGKNQTRLSSASVVGGPGFGKKKGGQIGFKGQNIGGGGGGGAGGAGGGGGSGNPEDNPALEKYVKMKKIGMPMASIINRMRMDQCHPDLIAEMSGY